MTRLVASNRKENSFSFCILSVLLRASFLNLIKKCESQSDVDQYLCVSGQRPAQHVKVSVGILTADHRHF